eukprot:gene9518-12139_t
MSTTPSATCPLCAPPFHHLSPNAHIDQMAEGDNYSPQFGFEAVGEVYSPQFGFAAVSRGALLPVFAAAGNASNGPSMRTLEFGGMRTELDFYCTPMPMGPDFQELFYLPKHLARDSIGICTDGLNSAGLSLAVQWDEMMGEIGIYKPHGGFLPVLNFVDVPSWILSRFSTVDEVLDALPAPKNTLGEPVVAHVFVTDVKGNSFDIVVYPLFNKIFDTLMGEPVVAHFIITDARGHSAVFEWIKNTYASWHWGNSFDIVVNPLFNKIFDTLMGKPVVAHFIITDARGHSAVFEWIKNTYASWHWGNSFDIVVNPLFNKIFDTLMGEPVVAHFIITDARGHSAVFEWIKNTYASWHWGNSFDIVVNPLFNKIFDTLMGEPVVAHFIITDARGHSAVFEWIKNTYASWHWGNSFDIVVNPLFNKIFDTLMGEPVVAHFIITDARGHSAVFEWINNTYASWHWVRNPYGVLTNTPQFPAQLKMLEDLEPKLEYWDCTGYSKAFFTPGVGESPDRFQRAVLLNRALGGLGKNAQFPDFVPISPNYKNDTNKAALVLADQILRTLTITGNIETGPMSWTQFSVLRDHKNRLYYIRPAAASLYSKYDLADLAGLPPGTIKMMPNLDMLVTDTPFCQEFHPADMNKASKRSLWKSILRSLHRTIGKLLD